jgi:hypothetical protein
LPVPLHLLKYTSCFSFLRVTLYFVFCSFFVTAGRQGYRL